MEMVGKDSQQYKILFVRLILEVNTGQKLKDKSDNDEQVVQ